MDLADPGHSRDGGHGHGMARRCRAALLFRVPPPHRPVCALYADAAQHVAAMPDEKYVAELQEEIRFVTGSRWCRLDWRPGHVIASCSEGYRHLGLREWDLPARADADAYRRTLSEAKRWADETCRTAE